MNNGEQFFNTSGGGYEIERSLRFNSADSAYLNRTPGSAGNRKTWTWAGWVKLSSSANRWSLFSTGQSGVTHDDVRIDTSGTVRVFFNGSSSADIETSQVLRDYSAWYHLIFSVDTTQATASNRLRIYINGQQVTALATASYPAQNYDTTINTAVAHKIGFNQLAATYSNFYLADVHFIDGQALGPTSFGKFDTNGVWQPKAYAGSYGTNGFHLPFSDNSTAAALGTDTSANSNTWTVTNISVTAGAGNDSLVDSPTNGTQTDTGVGGEVVGNYCTLNPLQSFVTLANGNLDASQVTAGHHPAYGTVGVSSGMWYFEFTKNDNAPTIGGTSIAIGVVGSNFTGINTASAFSTSTAHTAYIQNGTTYYDNETYPATTPNSATCHNAGIWMLAYDFDNGKGWIGKDGVWFSPGATSGGDPANGTNPIFTNFTVGTTYVPILHLYVATSVTVNFGQRPFAYTAPSGFKALCTANLPSTTITTSGSYTGNGVADGPFVYLNGVPTAMTVGGNAVTFGTHADKLSNGFKVRTNNTTYNQNAVVYNYSITSTGDPFKTARAQSN